MRYFFWLFFCFIKKIIYIQGSELKLYVSPKFLKPFVFCLMYMSILKFKVLVDMSAIDYPGSIFRFNIYYILGSMFMNTRLHIVTYVMEGYLLPTLTKLYVNAIWLEREVWDMYGVAFSRHPDLRRLLTDYGFNGCPLRKSFPLTGYTEIFYDDAQKMIMYEPVELAQDYRKFVLSF